MGRLIVGASTTCCFVSLALASLASAAQAQTSQPQTLQSVSQANSAANVTEISAIATWKPLEARSFTISEGVNLEEVFREY